MSALVKKVLSRELTEVADKLTSPAVWLGAISFEDRCTRSLEVLHKSGVTLSRVVALDYATIAQPLGENSERRRRHRREMQQIAEQSLASWEVVECEAYAYSAAADLIKVLIESVNSATPVVIDITCMTKVHAIAVAACAHLMTPRVVVAYTSPHNYPHPEEKKLAWRDIIIGPIAGSASFSNEEHSRGVILTGLESGRLIVSLAEIEPVGGLILFPDNHARPDLGKMNQNKNRRIVSQLTRSHATWRPEHVDMRSSDGVQDAVADEIAIAKRNDAPMILFPFGPKLFVFACAMELAARYAQASWFIYPIPAFYSVEYTEGAASTAWVPLKRLS